MNLVPVSHTVSDYVGAASTSHQHRQNHYFSSGSNARFSDTSNI